MCDIPGWGFAVFYKSHAVSALSIPECEIKYSMHPHYRRTTRKNGSWEVLQISVKRNKNMQHA